MVSPPILRYLFALLEPVTACAFFRFLALSYRERGGSERMETDAGNFYDTPPLELAGQADGPAPARRPSVSRPIASVASPSIFR
jgi:hypothetical protein